MRYNGQRQPDDESRRETVRCAGCGASFEWDDNFCRRCGWALRSSRLPVKGAVLTPAVWRRAAPAVVQGVAMVALGLAAETLLRTAASRAWRLPALLRPARSKGRALPVRRGEISSVGSVAVSETVVMRRVTLRR